MILDILVISLDFLACYFLTWVAVCYFLDVLPTDLSKQTLRSATGLQVFLPRAGEHRKTTRHRAAGTHETVTRSKTNIYARKK